MRQNTNLLRTRITGHHTKAFVYIPPDLAKFDWVFLRIDSTRRPFQQPYTGPHRVIDRSARSMTLWINEQATEVAIDRCKPAYIDRSNDIENNSEATATTSTAERTNERDDDGTWFNLPPALRQQPPTFERARQ